jgi:hypothetical protein
MFSLGKFWKLGPSEQTLLGTTVDDGTESRSLTTTAPIKEKKSSHPTNNVTGKVLNGLG